MASTVIEIGPGPGGLTRALLAEGARQVIAVERDRARDRRARGDRGALSRPARRSSPATRSSSIRKPYLDGGPARIVANLPYNIATALLVSWLTTEPWPPWYDRLVLMFQREVAERIVAAARQQDLWPAVGAGRLARRRRKSCSTSIRPPSCRRPR